MGRKKLTNEDYIEQLKEKGLWHRYRPLEEYKSNSVKIKHQCQTCSNIWDVSPNNLKAGRGCPKCSDKYVPTTENYREEAISLGYEPLEEYKGNNTPILHQCLTCRHEWKAQPTNIKSGCGCPKCANTNKAENLVNDYLKTTYPNQFQAQKKFKGLVGAGGGHLSFDFYLEIGSNRYLIELQGIQHYQPTNWNPDYFHTQQEHDRRKYNYARDHGYIYIAIPNTCSTAEKEHVIVPFLQTAIWLSETFGIQSHGYHLETCLGSPSHTQEIMQTTLF